MKINEVTEGKERLPIDFGNSLLSISGDEHVNIFNVYTTRANIRLSIEDHPQMHEGIGKMVSEEDYSDKVA